MHKFVKKRINTVSFTFKVNRDPLGGIGDFALDVPARCQLINKWAKAHPLNDTVYLKPSSHFVAFFIKHQRKTGMGYK